MKPTAIVDVYSLIRYFEGLSLKPVPDTRGRVLGWGRNIDVQGFYLHEFDYFDQKYGVDWKVHILDTVGIDDADAELMLKNDVQDRVGKLLKHDWFADLFQHDFGARGSVLVAMAFQMGAGIFDIKSPARWPAMIFALKAGHWTLAAIHALDSEWARTETPERAWIECAMLQSGQWPTAEQLKKQ